MGLRVVCIFALSGCNLITGASEFEIGDGGSAAQGGGAQGPGALAGPAGPGATNGPGSGGGESTTTTSTGATTGQGSACATPCAANESCDEGTGMCVCDPGFVDQGAGCVATAPGDPTSRTSAEVCARWSQDHVVTEPNPLVTNGMDCDAGSLRVGAINDTLKRINLFRWLSGLGPVSDDPALNATNQLCANLESWWNFSMPESPHSPPPSSKCYTAQGASGAGMSNIAWGSGPADSIDQFIEDNGNETTMGHRRWIVNPPLGKVGIGYWEGGGPYGRAECLAVFDSSGNGPQPPWVAVPNQGVVPAQVAQWTWSFHGGDGAIASATIAMLRVEDNTAIPVNVLTLSQGYGQTAISWRPMGAITAGMTYRVTVSGLTNGDITYDVKPVTCN